MHKPATTLPWASSDSRSELVFADSCGVIDFAKPVAMFQKPADAQFVLDAVDMLETVGQQIEAIRKAFGAPGDYGYGTASGEALYALYHSGISIRDALARTAMEERT